MSRSPKRLALTAAVSVVVTTVAAVAVFSVSDARRNTDEDHSARATTTSTSSSHSTRDDTRDDTGDDKRDHRSDDHPPAACRAQNANTDERDSRRQAANGTGATPGDQPDAQLVPSFLVGLPRSTFLKLDRRGRIVEAATNTSCPPTPGDTVYVAVPGGDILVAPYLDLAAIEWRGDFQIPGRYHRQDPQRGCLTPVPCTRIRP